MDKGKNTAGTIMSIIGIVLFFIAVIIAVVFIMIGTLMNGQKDKEHDAFLDFEEYAEKVSGVVINTDGGTTVSFEVDGEEHKAYFDVVTSEYPEGEKVTIYYDEDDPENYMAPDLVEGTYELLGKVFTFIGACIGGFLGVGGLILLIIGIVLKKKAKAPVDPYKTA